jgi:hypothetical protein
MAWRLLSCGLVLLLVLTGVSSVAAGPWFYARIDVPADQQPTDMGLADADLDGDLDVFLVFTHNGIVDGGPMLLLNENGSLVVSSALFPYFENGTTGRRLALADADGDAIADLFFGDLTYYYPYYFKMVVCLSSESWSGVQSLGTALELTEHETFDLGDLNGDGDADVAIAGRNRYDQLWLAVFLNAGDGTFPYDPTQVRELPTSVNDMIIADTDGDGDNDVLLGGDYLYLYENLGDGYLLTYVTYDIGVSVASMDARDLDGDRLPDLIVRESGQDQVALVRNAGLEGFLLMNELPAPSGTTDLAYADMDRDGSGDLIMLTPGSDLCQVWLGSGPWDYESYLEVALGDGSRTLGITDLDEDGWPDIVSSNYDAGTVSVALSREAQAWGTAIMDLGVSVQGFTCQDVNGDGLEDIVSVSGSTIRTFINDGGSDFVAGPQSGLPTSFARWAFGRLDSMEVVDVAVASDSYPEDEIHVLLNDGFGVFAVAHSLSIPGNISDLAI